MMNNFFKENLSHIIAIIAFVVITLAFFGPLLQGKHIKQHDTLQWQGMAKEVVDFREKTGEEPLWTNSMFGGMPTFQISVLYPTNVYMYVNDLFSKIFPGPSFYIFAALLTFYFLLIGLGFSPFVSFLGAFAFAFSSYNLIIIGAGHNSKANAIAWMPLIVLGVLLVFRGRYWIGGAITTFGVAMQINANHLQITYYLLLLLIFIGIVETIKVIKEKQWDRFLKSLGILTVSAALGILPNITSLLVTAEYAKETIRGKSELTMNQELKTSGLDKDYITQYSYGIDETFTLLVPNYKGGGNAALGGNKAAMQKVDSQMKQVVSQMDQYYGNQYSTAGPVYAGAIICFLFMLGLFIIKHPLKWALIAATVLSVMLAWGRNFMPLTDFFLDYVPGYNKFRAVTMTLVITQITFPLLGVMALWEIIKNPSMIKEKQKHFWIAFGLTGGLAFLMFLFPGLFNDFFKAGEVESILDQTAQANWSESQINFLLNSLEEARKAAFTADAMRSTIFITLAASLILLYSKMNFKSSYLIGGLILLIIADQFTVAKRYLNEEDFVKYNLRKQPFQPTEANLQIMQDPDPNFRVMNVTVSTFNDASTSYFHKSIGGYHGAKLKRYQELIEFQISKNNMNVLNMLNTKYFIVPGQDKQAVAQRNPEALGNAWFVDEHKLVANADSEIVALSDFDPSKVAIVDQRFASYVDVIPQGVKEGEIKLTESRSNYLKYQANTEQEALAVFSEIYYNDKKGWKAYIDGQKAEHIRVNYVLRALRIPAGEHIVEFKFEPQTYYTGLNIALAGSVLSLLFIGFGIYIYKKGIENKV